MSLWSSILSLSVLVSGCSAPATQRDLAEAERLEHLGQDQAALARYRAARQNCHKVGNIRQRRTTCAQAYTGYAELLDSLGEKRQAIVAYEETRRILASDKITAAKANYRAGRLLLRIGRRERGLRDLWSTVTQYANTVSAADALRTLELEGYRDRPRAFIRAMQQVLPKLRATDIADNLLYACARVADRALCEPQRALGFYDRIAKVPGQPLFDDALWQGARIARSLGDASGAVKRLRRLLKHGRVRARFDFLAGKAGSNRSVWLDDAQLMLGQVLRDDLGDHHAAIEVLRDLPKKFAASRLRDDALYELAITYDSSGAPRQAARARARLKRDWPESKYLLPGRKYQPDDKEGRRDHCR